MDIFRPLEGGIILLALPFTPEEVPLQSKHGDKGMYCVLGKC
jgi:hypothetical protein